MKIRNLRCADLSGAMRLKDEAGWNQTQTDWARLVELQPDGCFAIEEEGALAATATAMVYAPNLAWIGMVLTTPRYRGRGFARALMAYVLEFAEAAGVEQVGLDATGMGAPVYQRFGFEGECPAERWVRPAEADAPAVFAPEAWTPDPRLDAAAFGADRMRLLASLAREEAASIPKAGYAMGRPGSHAAYFGPCVAKSPDAADRLLRWFLARHPNEPVYWDLLPDNRDALGLARDYGFQPVRRLTRMRRTLRRGAAMATPDNSLVFALAGFELG